MTRAGPVIGLVNDLMDVLLEDWDPDLWAVASPLPGLLPGRLRASDEIESRLTKVLEDTWPEIITELESWWLAADHYHPLVIQEFGGCAEEVEALLRSGHGEAAKALVLKDRVYQSWGLAVRLLHESKKLRFTDPHCAMDLAQLALLISQILDPARYEPRWVADLEARCWAHLGNARRILGEMRSAAEAFGAAKRLLGSGTGRRLPWARVAVLEASLLTEAGDLDVARKLLTQVAAFYEEAQLRPEAGRSRLQLSKIVFEQGDPASAVRILRVAVADLDSATEPQLAYIAQENLAFYLLELGQVEEAETLMSRLEAPSDIVLLLRGIWIRALIQEAQGKLDLASQALTQLRDTYLRRDQGYDAALVSLDLAAVYLQQGKMAEVKALAGEIYPLFQAQGVEREALAAFLVFRRAADEEAATVDLVKSLSKLLKRIRK